MDFQLWIAFVSASIALLLIPGPTVLLVLSYALSQGRRVAVASALGVAFGDLVAMTAFVLGLGALVVTSAAAFTVVKWIGAAYLIWMGLGMLRAGGAKGLAVGDSPALPAKRIFRHAATVTALNPKSIIFFSAFVPQFIRPEDPLGPQFTIMTATFVGLAGINSLAYALLADRLRGMIRRPSILTWMTRAGGATLITMGALTATLRRAA